MKPWRRMYMIGIKGAGMSALAQVLARRGVIVEGSDVAETFITDGPLRDANILVREGFDARNIPDVADIVVISNAYLPRWGGEATTNQEVLEAERRGMSIVSYPEALGALSSDFSTLAVAGTHGKSTTTAMLGRMLEEAGLDPTVIVGAVVNDWGSNARIGGGKWLVVEADEYRNAFHHYRPLGAVITNIDYDHPDFFPTREAYRESFRKFRRSVYPGGFIVGPQHTNKLEIVGMSDVWEERWGAHCAHNAALAAEAARRIGVSDVAIRKALEMFGGLRRRMEHAGTAEFPNGPVIFYDDYAHHPEEIRATLAVARRRHPSSAQWIIFQPHTFSRTAALIDQFARVLAEADRAFIADIYASARERRGAVSADDLAQKIPGAVASGSPEQTLETVAAALRQERGNIVVTTMGAGNIGDCARRLFLRVDKAIVKDHTA